MEHIALISTGFFSLVAAWFAYNQYTKNKLIDMKIEQMKNDADDRISKNNRQIAVVYGELWTLLCKLDVDRCFVIQPHPEKRHLYLSVILEVNKKGVSMVKDVFQSIPMSEMAAFAKEMASNCWMYFDDIENQVLDNRTKSLMRLSGSSHIAIRQLINIHGEWIGSLVVENVGNNPLVCTSVKEDVDAVANTIQFILPKLQ